MLLGLGAASSALDALQSLTAKKSTSTTGVTQNRQTPDFFGRTESPGLLSNSSAAPKGSSSKSGALSPELLSALLAALGQTDSSTGGSDGASSSDGSNPLKDLFAQIDADGDGQLSKLEFENSLGAGGSNTAQADDVFSKLDKDGDGSVSLNEVVSALQGKVHRHQHQVGDSGSATDAGGAASSASGAATSSYNFIEQMIARQAKAISSAATASLSVSA